MGDLIITHVYSLVVEVGRRQVLHVVHAHTFLYVLLLQLGHFLLDLFAVFVVEGDADAVGTLQLVGQMLLQLRGIVLDTEQESPLAVYPCALNVLDVGDVHGAVLKRCRESEDVHVVGLLLLGSGFVGYCNAYQ